ncbi:helix-hairpin-helix domain-containing protein [Clostridium septicum]|uniref:Competence protein ComEA n=1 Tax=Clostridium septicum TaxID=1504 RepID=A0A9N7JMF0_CLOSE|nr:helix-hairpin-helix domain-containing protein [Clostridium septicum]AYE34834.1 competence protein ComEA [Clostridium septicum]MDU1313350.1 helix-hairpin-helix domain-containing protein [Clostridium septicum]QAS60229.1 competence protein ComEA [Clostridium septicum]UEC20517.1 helix-hairpin-helix domain-containing protein [Clostridium septicum]USS01428.1 helix-hairpin-helix domain-containing protein [Clostridium septicum]
MKKINIKYLKSFNLYNYKKFIGILILLIISITFIFLKYDDNKNKVFKDEYMKEIFVEENIDELEKEDIPSNSEVVSNNIKENNSTDVVVEIKGEVKKPDVYTLKDGSIIKDLIDIAGGITENGDISMINRADILKNHQLIIVPNINDKKEQGDGVKVIGAELQSNLNSSNTHSKVNINTADINELKTIKGIGDSKAENIIKYREVNGAFKSIDEIKQVTGIGDKIFENMKDQITI